MPPKKNKTHRKGEKSHSPQEPKSQNVTMRNFLTRTDRAKSPSIFIYNPWTHNGGPDRANIELDGRYKLIFPSSSERRRISEKWGRRAKTARATLNINEQLLPIGDIKVTRNSRSGGNKRTKRRRRHSR